MSRLSRRPGARSARSESSIHSEETHTEEGAGHRRARLEQILLVELQSLIRDEATDPSLDDLQVLDVSLQDGGNARVAYAVIAALCDEQEAGRRSREGLRRAAGFLRTRLAQQLDLKKLPKLTFTFVGVVEEDSMPLEEASDPRGDT